MMMNQAFQKHGEPASAVSGILWCAGFICGGCKCFLHFIAFMIITMTAGTSMADGVLPCPVDTVPIQIMKGPEQKITFKPKINIKRGADLDTIETITTLSSAEIYDNPTGFAAFVSAVTEHVAAKLTQEKLCLDSAESQKRSLLQFVALPLIGIEGFRPLAAVPPLEAMPSGSGCRISSPWIDIVIERKPIPWVRGFVRWNERQLLADQAILAGEQNVPPGVAIPFKPLTDDEFKEGITVVGSELPNEYKKYVLDYSRTMSSRKAMEKLIEEQRVPPDLLWLFRRATQTTLVPFYNVADDAMNKAMKKGATGYAKIVISLIDHCFASDGADMKYRNILDINDLALLEQYKIVTSLYD